MAGKKAGTRVCSAITGQFVKRYRSWSSKTTVKKPSNLARGVRNRLTHILEVFCSITRVHLTTNMRILL